MKLTLLNIMIFATLGSYHAGYQSNLPGSAYQSQAGHQSSAQQWQFKTQQQVGGFPQQQRIGGYPQPQQQTAGLPPSVGTPQVFIDTMGSEVEMEWERCVDSLIKSPDSMAQLDQMGDPWSLEKLLKQDQSTTYTFSFKDGSTVVFQEKPGFSPELLSVDFGANPNLAPAASDRNSMKPGYQPQSSAFMQPSNFQNCASCVMNHFVWAGGNCVEDCNMIQDVACWKHLKGCETEQKQQKEIQSCQLAADCMSCVDSGDSCVWDQTSCFSTIPLFMQPHDVISQKRDCPVPLQPNAPPSLVTPIAPQQPSAPIWPQHSAPMQPAPPSAGGWTSGMNRQNMQAKWNEVLAKNSNSALISISNLESLDEPVSVETQVVAGVNYKFTFQDGTQVIVLEQVWMNILTITNVISPAGQRLLKAGPTLRSSQHQVETKGLSPLSLLLTVFGGILAGALLALSRELCFNKQTGDVYTDLAQDAQQRKV